MAELSLNEIVDALMHKILDIPDRRTLKNVIRNIKKRLDELEKVTKKIDKI